MDDSSSRAAPDYSEFSDPRLVAIYDTVNPIDSYRAFFIDLAARLAPRSIKDIGAGTGLLTCELSARGYDMIGVEPATPLLDLARNRPGCEGVQWIEG
jgi:predicted RNA methylase